MICCVYLISTVLWVVIPALWPTPMLCQFFYDVGDAVLVLASACWPLTLTTRSPLIESRKPRMVFSVPETQSAGSSDSGILIDFVHDCFRAHLAQRLAITPLQKYIVGFRTPPTWDPSLVARSAASLGVSVSAFTWRTHDYLQLLP